MGNIVGNISGKKCEQNANGLLDNDQSGPNQARALPSVPLEPTISIPMETEMSTSEGKRIKFRVRHAASDFSATVEAHDDHTISTLKRYLVEHMGMPFPSEDGKCKILMVWNKPDLLRDEPSKMDKLEMDHRYLGGSIDRLQLGTYGLESGDFLMFTVMFPQILTASANSLK